MLTAWSEQQLDFEGLRLTCRQCSLQELCLPASLRDHELSLLASILGHSNIQQGQHIFNAGDRFQSLCVVRSGAVKTWVTGLNGSMQILGFHFPGEMLGFDGLAERRHHCTAEALSGTEICRLPYGQLERVATRIPALQKQLFRIMSREFVLDNEHLVMMGSRPAVERVALFVQTMSQRRGLLGHDRTIIDLSMSRVDIGNYLSLATETVSRLLAELEREGVIDLDRRHLRIRDLDRLIEISGEDLGLLHYPD